ncbi:MAG TPA: DUF1080 domain-containing protein [Gemmata sp.]
MLARRLLLVCAFAALTGALLPAEDKKPAPAGGAVKSLYNGKNLDGWVNVNCAPDTFFAKGEEIITTGKPTGFLRTDKQYENFELDFDWMHVEKEKMANSGLFVWGDPLPAVGTGYTRGIEVQVLINYAPKDGWATCHGDIFSIWGAKCTPDRPHFKGIERCLPSENRVRGGGEWNHYKVIANDGAIKLHVNGKEVSGVSKCNPRKGYLALESEGVECHFKNLKIKELPSTNPKPEECAKVAEGHVSLFNGVDLKGWKTEKDAWKAGGGVLKAVGKGALVSEKEWDRSEVVFDWKRPAKSDGKIEVEVAGIAVTAAEGLVSAKWDAGPGGGSNATASFTPEAKQAVKPGTWNRAVITQDGKEITIAINGKVVHRMRTTAAKAPVIFRPSEGLEIMNVFAKELPAKK